MTLSDTLRTESHVQRYDFWLDVYGVPGPSRRSLVRELRGNIAEAAADLGTAPALRRLGAPKSLAAQAGEALADPSRPCWRGGFAVAVAASATYLLVEVFALLQFAAGVSASGVTSTVTGMLLGYPGVTAQAHLGDDSLWIGSSGVPWLIFPIFLVALVIGAKSWRLVTRRYAAAEGGGRPGGLLPVRPVLPVDDIERSPRWAPGAITGVLVALVLGTSTWYDDSGFHVGASGAPWWAALLAGTVVFIAVARAWRLRDRTTRATNAQVSERVDSIS